ncbi:MAG: hypothetical protein PHI85_08770 [Victivallaceae bacterium]|nr:hypothetical protein [Victivallaceae bacterium]
MSIGSGVLYGSGSTIGLVNVTFCDNTASDGSIAALKNCDTTISGGILLNNSSFAREADGGALNVEDGRLQMFGTVFSGNNLLGGHNAAGGALCIARTDGAQEQLDASKVDGCSFFGNCVSADEMSSGATVHTYGGAIVICGGGETAHNSVRITNTAFNSNCVSANVVYNGPSWYTSREYFGGGAIYCSGVDYADVVFLGNSFLNNRIVFSPGVSTCTVNKVTQCAGGALAFHRANNSSTARLESGGFWDNIIEGTIDKGGAVSSAYSAEYNFEGGAVYCPSAVSGVDFERNRIRLNVGCATAGRSIRACGGAVFFYPNAPDLYAQISASIFTGNAIEISAFKADAQSSGSNGTVIAYGGAVFKPQTISETVFTGNNLTFAADYDSYIVTVCGGAVYGDGMNLTAVDFNGNYISVKQPSVAGGLIAGGAVFNNGGKLSITNCNFTGNYISTGGTSYGGAIYISRAADIADTSFSGNYIAATANSTDKSYGGAIFLAAGATCRYTVSPGKTISNVNNYSDNGGFMYLSQASEAAFDIGAGGVLEIGDIWLVDDTRSEEDTIAGEGTIVKTGDGVMRYRSSLSGFTGKWRIDAGELCVGYGLYNGYGLTMSDVTVGVAKLTATDYASLSNVKILSGGLAVINSSCTAGKTQVFSGGLLMVEGGGNIYNTDILAGAVVMLHGRGESSTIVSGGLLNVIGASSTADTVSDGGVAATREEGTLSNTQIKAGGIAIAQSGGEVIGAWASSGAIIRSEDGGSVVYANLRSGSLLTLVGGKAHDNQIASGAELVVSSGHASYNRNAGVIKVLSGGTANGNGICSGGTEHVYSGGSVELEVLVGNAVQYIHSGGVASLTDINSGGSSVIFSGGLSSSSEVYGGGVLTVSAGGYSTNDNIYEDGLLLAESGAMIADVHVMAGGELRLSDGAVLDQMLYYAHGGKLTADGKVGGNVEISFDLPEQSAAPVFPDLSWLVGQAVLTAKMHSGDRHSGIYTLAGNAPSVKMMGIGIISESGYSTYYMYPDRQCIVGDETYSYALERGNVVLSITGKYTDAFGTVENNDSVLQLFNCRVKSIIAGAAEDVAGNVKGTVNLLAAASPCNVYGGGNNVNVGGNIDLALTGGGYSGVVYGGSRAYAKTVAVHDIAISVGAIVHSDNQKLIAAGKGNSAWIVGGGVADNAQTLTAGAVNITIDGANVVRVVGGAQAQNAGSTATAASVNITVRNSTVAGDLFGGGYAYNGGTSVVSGTTAVTIDTTAANVTVMGNIYGGGANPSYYSRGGSTLVKGGSTVTFTGLGEKLTVGTVSGDGMIAGTVAGARTLEFKAFSGEFSANLKNFDAVVFSGSSGVVYSGNYEFNTMTIEHGSFADGFSFADGDRLLKIETRDSTSGFDLMTVDDISTLDGLKVELFKNDALLCSFNYGETKDGYALEFANGMLSLTQK